MINSFVQRISSILKENMVNLNDQIINSMYNQTPRCFHCSNCIKEKEIMFLIEPTLKIFIFYFLFIYDIRFFLNNHYLK